jgi:outer membrane protein assembly factor BamB
MVRIRAGSAWRHDPALRAAARHRIGPARIAAAREVVGALALEVDGVDIAAGLAEGPLLAGLEALLRAVARVVRGEPHATVGFADGAVELLIRRRGRSAFLSVVALSRPSRVLARDVEVEVDALASAVLDASATLCAELAEVLPGAEAREARPLRAAARALRRAEGEAPASRSVRGRVRGRAVRRPAPDGAPVSCVVELEDEDDLLCAYEGGRPDLGSLLGPGRIALRAADGRELASLAGLPFLAARDLAAAADALLAAVRTGDARCELALARPGTGAPVTLAVDLHGRTVSGPGAREVPCPPLALARALGEAQAELGRIARQRNPRQAENAQVAELERSAAARRAIVDELAEGDRRSAFPAPGRVPAAPRLPQRPLGPGRMRRLAFRATFRVDVGAPAGAGLHRAGSAALVTGAGLVAAFELVTGAERWRAPGCTFAALAGGVLLVASAGELRALAPRSGRAAWSRPLPGMTPVAAATLGRGPVVLVERDAATGLDPASGRSLWRFEPPGAARLHATAFGGLLVVGTDTGLLYGLDVTGRLVWRVRAPGPVLRRPVAAVGLCLALSASDAGGTALLAVDPAAGERRWEAPLDCSGPASVLPWGGRVAIAGAVAGDPIVTAVGRDGAPGWTVAPALAGAATAAAAGPLLVARDGAGALAALGRDGSVRWSRPAPSSPASSRATPPLVVRGTVLASGGDAVQALDARTGELLGTLPAAAARLLADEGLAVAALDADGLATGWRLATHLSVV